MLLLYCMISPIPEPFIIFSMLYDHMIGDMLLLYFVTYVTILYNIILYFLSQFKIKKSESENQK